MSAQKRKLTLSYDEDHDVLYVNIGTPKLSYCDKDIDGILIRRSYDNHRYSGVTIMNFSKKTKEQLQTNIPFKLDINELYKPL